MQYTKIYHLQISTARGHMETHLRSVVWYGRNDD